MKNYSIDTKRIPNNTLERHETYTIS